MLIFYRFFVYPLLLIGAFVIAVAGNSKVRETLRLRRRWVGFLPAVASPRQRTIVVHSASAGEFEQARPVLSELRRRDPDLRVVATFGSVSGLMQHASAPEVDIVLPLPFDRVRDCRDFLGALGPDAVLVMRYDLWPVIARQIRNRRIPLVLLCGTLVRGSARASLWYNWLTAQPYRCLSAALMVDPTDVEALHRLAPRVPAFAVGDTRYDRVVERACQSVALPLPRPDSRWLTVVAGSTWDADEDLLADLAMESRIRLVIVPHEPTEEHLEQTERRFPGIVRLSRCLGEWPRAGIVVDSIGILSAIYRLGDVAYVGGGFGAGVHSVLEPAAYDLPVICGPRIERSRDATSMRNLGLLTVVIDRPGLASAVSSFLESSDYRRNVGRRTGSFVRERSGATARIVDRLERLGITARIDTR